MDEVQLKRVQSDVDSMNKSFGNEVAISNETDPPSTEAVKTDAPTTEQPKEEDVKTEAPTTEQPEDKDKTILDLRAKLAEKSTEVVKSKVPTTDAPLKIEDQDFVGDLDLSDLSESKEGLNKLLNAVYAKGLNDSVKTIKGTIPDTINSQMSEINRLQEVNRLFYSENEDLKPFQKVVAVVFGEISGSDPSKTLVDVLTATGPEVRRRLGLPINQQKAKPKGTDNPPPKLPGKKGNQGRSTETPPLTGFDAELASMNNSLGR